MELVGEETMKRELARKTTTGKEPERGEAITRQQNILEGRE